MNPSSPTPISEADIHAYVDGQLAPERVTRVEAALGVDAVQTERVAAMRAQNAALRDALDPVLAEPIPERLLAAATSPRGRAAGARRWFAAAFAMAATLLVGVGIGWFGRDALIDAVCAWYTERGVRFELVELDFKGPYNRAIVSEPSE